MPSPPAVDDDDVAVVVQDPAVPESGQTTRLSTVRAAFITPSGKRPAPDLWRDARFNGLTSPRSGYSRSSMPSTEVISSRLLAAFPDARVEVADLTGTSDHFQALVVTRAFEGRSRIEQHQMVYAALGDLMKGEIHRWP